MDAGWDDDDVSTGEGLFHAIVVGEVAVDLGNRRDMRQIGGDAGGVDDIVEGEVVDLLVRLEEEGEWLIRHQH